VNSVHSRQGKWCLEASCCGGGVVLVRRADTYPKVRRDFSTLKRSMIEKNPQIVYRYRADLAERARQSVATHQAAFVRFHGSDLAVFADALTAAAAEQQSLREQIEAKIGLTCRLISQNTDLIEPDRNYHGRGS